MKCKITQKQEGLCKVKLKLTTAQLVSLRRILSNSSEDYAGNGDTNNNFADVIVKAMIKAEITAM